jgi:surface polysaccharide O-acyltransferase-like enzyme
MAAGLPVLFRGKFKYSGQFARSLTASTYTVLIIHAPVLVILTIVLTSFQLYPLLKFILVAPFAVAVNFLLANMIRKLPFARNIL